MALVRDLAPGLTFNFADNNSKPARLTIYLDREEDDLVALLAAANALRNAIVPLSNAGLIDAKLTFPLTENAAVAAIPESEVERKLLLPMRGINKRVTYTGEIPSVVFSVEQVGTDNVDPANPLVAALFNALVANARTSRGEALITLNGIPYVDHRNRAKS